MGKDYWRGSRPAKVLFKERGKIIVNIKNSVPFIKYDGIVVSIYYIV